MIGGQGELSPPASSASGCDILRSAATS